MHAQLLGLRAREPVIVEAGPRAIEQRTAQDDVVHLAFMLGAPGSVKSIDLHIGTWWLVELASDETWLSGDLANRGPFVRRIPTTSVVGARQRVA